MAKPDSNDLNSDSAPAAPRAQRLAETFANIITDHLAKADFLSSPNLRERLSQFVREEFAKHTERVVPEVARELAKAVQSNFSASFESLGFGIPKNPNTLFDRCPYPGCQNPPGGPRNGFFCAQHKALPKKERDEYRHEYLAAKKANERTATPGRKMGRRKRGASAPA